MVAGENWRCTTYDGYFGWPAIWGQLVATKGGGRRPRDLGSGRDVGREEMRRQRGSPSSRQAEEREEARGRSAAELAREEEKSGMRLIQQFSRTVCSVIWGLWGFPYFGPTDTVLALKHGSDLQR